MSQASNSVFGKCKLCERKRHLCNTHIIPEMCYKPLYDDKHRLHNVSIDDIDSFSYTQKGLRDYMLCPACEKLLNDQYEKPFKQEWIDAKHLDKAEVGKILNIDGLTYSSFKLFHLSILFRAHFSTSIFFRNVVLSRKHLRKIREYLLSNNAPEESEYPIVAMLFRGPEGEIRDDFIGPFHEMTMEGNRSFYVCFSGVQWMYYLGEIKNDSISTFCIKREGTLITAPMNWLALEKIYLPNYRAKQRSVANIWNNMKAETS